AITSTPALEQVGGIVSGTSRTTISHRGQLQYVDTLHNGKGVVLLGVTSSCCPVGDRYFLRFEDVAITNAPDVHVYLSTDRGGKWSPSTSKYLGPLTATNGSFNDDVTRVRRERGQQAELRRRELEVLIVHGDPVGAGVDRESPDLHRAAGNGLRRAP